jgi:transposase
MSPEEMSDTRGWHCFFHGGFTSVGLVVCKLLFPALYSQKPKTKSVEGSTTRDAFEAYVERALCPSLRPGQVAVMDNHSSHKGSRVRELIEEKGGELLYLPPYSPDLNPIEEAFAKLKALLRRAGARTREALVEAMGRALEAVKVSDARGFFEHRGYQTPGQLL